MNIKISLLFLIIISITISCKTDSQSNIANSEQSTQTENEATSNSSDELITIYTNKVGPFARGEVIDEQNHDTSVKFIKASEKLRSGSTKEYYSYLKDGTEEMKIYPAMDGRTKTYTSLVGSISINSRNYKDELGISIGSTIANFINTYPKAYAYFDMADEKLILSNEGQGLQYVSSISAIQKDEIINIGRIKLDQIITSAKIEEIRIVRSEQENEMAKTNKFMEEQEILEKYLESVSGKYFLNEFSENYYKIYKLQGDYFIAECNEDDCQNQGKIISSAKSKNGYVSLNLEGIQGENVPTWSLKSLGKGKTELAVYNYNGFEDKWVDQVFIKETN